MGRITYVCKKCGSMTMNSMQACLCGGLACLVIVDFSRVSKAEVETYMALAPMPWPLERKFIPDET